MGVARKVREIVWGAPAETKAERRLIVKIDFFILSYVALMYWVSSELSLNSTTAA